MSMIARLVVFLIIITATFTPGRGARAFVASFGWAPAQILTEWPLEDVKFTNASTGWTVGSNGLIFKTTNGGKSWTQKTSGTTAVLYALDFSGTNVWAVGIGTTVKSTDSGETWTAATSADRFYSVDFVSDTVGYRVGEVTGSGAGLIQKTTDGGITWSTHSLPANTKTIFDIHCTDANNCVAVGRDGLILRTINGGTLWKSKSSGTIGIFQDAHFPTVSTGFAVGETGQVRKSDNAGDSWFNPVSGGGNATTKDLHGVFFTSTASGYAVGADGTIASTSDGGATWTAVNSGTTNTLRAVYFTDATHGWTVGSGTLVRYGDMQAPGAPANVVRTSGGADFTPTFTWSAATDNVGIDSYEMEILKESTVVVARTNIGNVLTYTVPDSQVLSGGQYNFAVYALDAFGNRSNRSGTIFTLPFPPNPPANLAQRDALGGADQAAGFTDDDDTVVFASTLSNPESGITFKLELEIRTVGAAFTNTATSASDWAQNGATVQQAVSGLANGSYHWQARAVRGGGDNLVSSWVAFGGNSEDTADFTISIPSAPPPTPPPPPDTGGGTSGGGTSGGGTTGGGTTGGGTTGGGGTTPATPPTPSVSGPPFSLDQMQADAAVVTQGSIATLLQALNLPSAALCQMPEETSRAKVTAVFGTITSEIIRNAIINFTSCGTVSTLHLGAGERLGTVNSYKSAFGRLPETSAHWFDVIKIANGRFPGETSTTAESGAKARFQKIYARNPNMNQQNDKAAVTVMAYGLRPLPRNLNSEKSAISIFKKIFSYAPTSAIDWDAVRAIAYSGATR